MTDQHERQKFDWASIVILLASIGILVTGILLNSLTVDNALRSGLLVAVFAATAGTAAGFGGYLASRRQFERVRFDLSKTESELKVKMEGLSNDVNRDFQAFRADITASFQLVEHSVFEHLASKSTSGDGRPQQIAQIGLAEVTMIEEHAQEVWVYAVDLMFDVPESRFSSVVENNLHEKVHYQYLIPNNADSLSRVSAILERFEDIADLDKLFAVRVRGEQTPLGLFGFCIYNPTYGKSKEAIARQHGRTHVIQFPRLVSPQSEAAESSFARYGGGMIHEHEAAFYQLWQASKPYMKNKA